MMPVHLRATQDIAEGKAISYKTLGLSGDGVAIEPKSALDNLASAIDEGGALQLDDAPVFRLGETVDWSLLRGRRLWTGRLPSPDGVNVPKFIWDGPAHGTMFKLDRVNTLALEGMAFETDDRAQQRAPAGIVFDLDGGYDTRTDPTQQEIGSSCRFKHLRHITNTPDPDVTIARATVPDVVGGPSDVVQVPGPIFFSIAACTQYNQEYHGFEDVNGNGNGAGTFLFQGRSPNIVATRVRDSRGVLGYKRGIYAHGGSIHLDLINFSGCEWALWLENASQMSTLTRLHGEVNQHWAYIDAPILSFGNKWDPERAQLDAQGRGFIHFGPFAAYVTLQGAWDGGLPADAVAFTWDNDASNRVVDIELIAPRDIVHTRQQLGIDTHSLIGKGNTSRQARFVRFRTNPGAVSDLPGGLLEFNWPTAVIETAAGDWVNDLPVMRKLSKTPVDYATLTPGVAGEHIDTVSGYIRQRSRFNDGTAAETPLGAYRKLKP